MKKQIMNWVIFLVGLGCFLAPFFISRTSENWHEIWLVSSIFSALLLLWTAYKLNKKTLDGRESLKKSSFAFFVFIVSLIAGGLSIGFAFVDPVLNIMTIFSGFFSVVSIELLIAILILSIIVLMDKETDSCIKSAEKKYFPESS